MDIGQLIRRHAAYRPDRMAVVFGDTRLTYREFNADVNRMANALRRAGIGKGDKVATVLPNCLELLSLFWAVAKTGAVAVPLSPLLGPAALGALLRDSDSTIVFTTSDQTDTFDRIRDRLPDIGEKNVILINGPVDGPADGERPGFCGLKPSSPTLRSTSRRTPASPTPTCSTSSTAAAQRASQRASCTPTMSGPCTAASLPQVGA